MEDLDLARSRLHWLLHFHLDCLDLLLSSSASPSSPDVLLLDDNVATLRRALDALARHGSAPLQDGSRLARRVHAALHLRPPSTFLRGGGARSGDRRSASTGRDPPSDDKDEDDKEEEEEDEEEEEAVVVRRRVIRRAKPAWNVSTRVNKGKGKGKEKEKDAAVPRRKKASRRRLGELAQPKWVNEPPPPPQRFFETVVVTRKIKKRAKGKGKAKRKTTFVPASTSSSSSYSSSASSTASPSSSSLSSSSSSASFASYSSASSSSSDTTWIERVHEAESRTRSALDRAERLTSPWSSSSSSSSPARSALNRSVDAGVQTDEPVEPVDVSAVFTPPPTRRAPKKPAPAVFTPPRTRPSAERLSYVQVLERIEAERRRRREAAAARASVESAREEIETFLGDVDISGA